MPYRPSVWYCLYALDPTNDKLETDMEGDIHFSDKEKHCLLMNVSENNHRLLKIVWAQTVLKKLHTEMCYTHQCCIQSG